ncbi:TldD/PmbA family protein [Sedimentibacter sp. zth1]|uniref:TldD/PmbA family protein n=1 Tax=Sedimentibacter sp. zth1 TaxID=2816908 RepID=UPI001A93192D|nr:TldD/PmbA family protein [Sedimentibacter sp. zth1]QSX06169.1 TldD/PmbA family protein [Sedimentibacter sp. zth1]
MIIKEYINKVITMFNKEGITNVEVYYNNTITKLVNIENNDIESFKTANDSGINISGNYDGYNSSTYIEKYDDKSIYDAIKNIKDTAKINNKPLKLQMFSDIAKCNKNNNIVNTDLDNVKKVLINIEKSAKRIDNRVISVTDCSYYEVLNNILLINNEGIELEDTYSYCIGTVSVVVGENEIKNNATSSVIKNRFDDIDYDKLMHNAIGDAINMLSASPIKSGKYKVVLRNNAAADILTCFMPIFNIENINKGISKFKDKLNTNVASKCFSLIDDPLYENGKLKRNFDDEGTKTCKKYLIKEGVLNSYLSKNAIDNISTGNAFRYSYRENIEISQTNCFVEKGSQTTKEIIENINDGIIITSFDGLNAGINTVTGDFSLISNGFYIKNGRIEKSINQITVGGNIYEVINDIECVSSDVECAYSYGDYFESPSILINNLMIGGL